MSLLDGKKRKKQKFLSIIFLIIQQKQRKIKKPVDDLMLIYGRIQKLKINNKYVIELKHPIVRFVKLETKTP